MGMDSGVGVLNKTRVLRMTTRTIICNLNLMIHQRMRSVGLERSSHLIDDRLVHVNGDHSELGY